MGFDFWLEADVTQAQSQDMTGREKMDALGAVGQPLFATTHWSVDLAAANDEKPEATAMDSGCPMLAMVAVVALGAAWPAFASTNEFFNGSQIAGLVVSNINAVTIQSGDYRFTCSADGYWSSGGGAPTGRFFSIFWPTGVQAQAITAGPLLGKGANITLQRADGKIFDLQAFTGNRSLTSRCRSSQERYRANTTRPDLSR